MTADAMIALKTLMSGLWSLFDMNYPGLNMTVKSVIFGLFMISVMGNVLRFTFGFGRSMGRSDRARGRKVSSERRNDEK